MRFVKIFSASNPSTFPPENSCFSVNWSSKARLVGTMAGLMVGMSELRDCYQSDVGKEYMN